MVEIKFTSKNEKKSFKNIFENYYPPLCHLGNYYLEDYDEAKGVVQEAFVKLWDLRNEIKSDSNIKNFLFTMVKNSCINILKRRQIIIKHHNKIKETEIRYQYESLNRINEDYLELKELKERIDAAINNLPQHCRIVFEMSRFQDMKYHQIAEKLGITQKAVEARMTKTLKILRKELKDYLPLVMFFTNLLI